MAGNCYAFFIQVNGGAGKQEVGGQKYEAGGAD